MPDQTGFQLSGTMTSLIYLHQVFLDPFSRARAGNSFSTLPTYQRGAFQSYLHRRAKPLPSVTPIPVHGENPSNT